MAHIDGDVLGTLTDSVTATGSPPHGDDVSDTDTADVTAYSASIDVEKTADPMEGAPSTDVTFTIAVTNTGNCTLDPVKKVVDTLPSGMSYVSDDSGGIESPTGTITWNNVGPMNSTEDTTISLVAHIDVGASGTLTDTVTAIGTPPAGANVTDTDTADVLVLGPVINISANLTKSSDPSIVPPGGNVTYRIYFENTGDVTLTNVTIIDYYPEGVTFISASPAPDPGTNNIWTWGDLTPGQSGMITINVTVPESWERGYSFTESGSVRGEGFLMVSKELSTGQKPYKLTNVVTLTCDHLFRSATAVTTVSGVPGTSMSITEHGSGIYESDESINLCTRNRTLRPRTV